MTPKLRILLGSLLVTVPPDQLSKIEVERRLAEYERFPVVDGFFYVTHVRNPGAAFGLFADASPELRMFVFALVSLVAAYVIVTFFVSLAPGDRVSALALGLILGGAVGNFLDRILRGAVLDFLHFRLWGGYTWPDFNLADVFIVVGVAALMLELLAAEGAARAEPPRVELDV